MSTDFEGLIKGALEQGAKEVTEEIIEEAKEKLAVEIRKYADSIALGLLSEYDIARNQKNLIITVKKYFDEK